MRSYYKSSLACMMCLAAVLAHAQLGAVAAPQAGPQPDVPEPAQLWTGNLGDEPVGVGDLVYISVTGSPELSRSYRVSNDGSLSLPLLHEPVAISGMIPAAIGRAVSAELVREKILVSPIVSVSVLEYRSRRVGVVGAVKAPVLIQAVGELKLLDAIARAQGFAPDAGPEVVVTRRAETGATETIQIPIKDLLAGKNPALNLTLHGGEEIRVPEAPKLFIVGNVKTPGSYPMNEMGGSSVLKALAMSQGTLAFTAKEAYVYRLKPGSTDRQEIAIPLKDILHRKSPDVQLQANDILYIPENSRAHLNASVLDRITGFGGQVGSGLLVFH